MVGSSKDALEFVAFCEMFKIPYRTEGKHTRRGWVQIDCPNCGRESGKFHLGFNLKYRTLNCWKCGKKALGPTLATISGLSIGRLSAFIARIPKIEFEQVEIQGTFVVPKGVGPLNDAHKRYLLDRNFNWRRIVKLWNVQGIGVAKELQHRLWIPIEYGGKQRSWTTRTISKNPDITRYISASPNQELINHKKLLYGEDYAGNTIIVVEGPMDVWRIGPGACGTFGTRPTAAQVARIAKYPVRYVCFDHGAERQAQSLVETLSAFPGETHQIVLDAEDPDSMSRKELAQVRKLLE